jgi:Icc protein
MLIAQISDTHIVEKNTHWLSEPATETHERLSRVITYINELTRQPDLVLLTGDVTDAGTEQAYAHLTELLKPLKPPCYLIPGNHDRREAFRKAFADQPYLPKKGFLHYVIEEFPIRLIGLDTLAEGYSYGEICEERFHWLERVLLTSQRPTLIFMHHPPVKIGIKIFDQVRCVAPAGFEQLIASQPHLIGIITGHYHHTCVSSFGGKICFLAPSTAPVHYFSHPETESVSALELEEPALTLHRWLDGKSLASQVYRIKQDFLRIDWSKIEQGGKK